MFAKQSVLAASLAASLPAAALLPPAANAQVGATADVGSTGVGFHVVVPVNAYLHARVGASYFRHNFNRTSNGVDYDIKGKLQTVDALLDWYLAEDASFHLTGGVVYNGNKFDAHARPNGPGTFTLNGNTYTTADVGILDGRIDYRKAAPYLGVGWGNALAPSARWTSSIDLGMFYQGSPNVQLASVGCAAAASVCQAVANDVAAERLHLQQDSDSFKVYPVVRVSIGYRF